MRPKVLTCYLRERTPGFADHVDRISVYLSSAGRERDVGFIGESIQGPSTSDQRLQHLKYFTHQRHGGIDGAT